MDEKPREYCKMSIAGIIRCREVQQKEDIQRGVLFREGTVLHLHAGHFSQSIQLVCEGIILLGRRFDKSVVAVVGCAGKKPVHSSRKY